MNTETLKHTAAELQRKEPASAKAKEAQRAYQAALNEEARNQRASEYLREKERKAALQREIDFARKDPRSEATVSVGVYSDWATTAGFSHHYDKWQKAIGRSIGLGYVIHDVDDGSPLCGSVKKYPCKIISVGKGAYSSDSVNGRSGWHLLVTVDLPEELQHATLLNGE